MLTEQIMKSSPLSRIIVSVSTVIIIAIAAYNWTISPQTTYLRASQQYNEINDTVKKKSLLLRKSVSIKKKKVKEINEEIDKLKSSFFTPSQSSKFFRNLETLAMQSGCNIELITFKAIDRSSDDESEIGKVSFYPKNASVKFFGGYEQIINFLKIITDTPKRLSLSDLSLNSSQDVQGLACHIDITVYILEKARIPNENG